MGAGNEVEKEVGCPKEDTRRKEGKVDREESDRVKTRKIWNGCQAGDSGREKDRKG